MKHPDTPWFHLHGLCLQSTTLIFPGLRELLTQTSGDIRSSQSYPSMGGGSVPHATGKFLGASEYGLFPFHSPTLISKNHERFTLLFILPSQQSFPVLCVFWLLTKNLVCMYETEQILYSFLSDRFKK